MTDRFPISTRRRTAAVIATLAAAWLCLAALRHELASHYAASPNFEDWERASRIEPGSPQIWYQLGRFRQLDFDHSDLPMAVADYRRAVRLNPRSPYYQLDLASALEMSGNNEEADRYFRSAQASYPISAEVSWKYGNFLLRQQRLPEAYAEIRRAVSVDAKLLPLAISRAWHSNPDVRLLLDQVLPDTPEAHWGALAFLTEARDGAAALAVWNRLATERTRMDWHRVFALTEMLVGLERFEEAGSVWRQALADDQGASLAYADGSLVYDGGFERDISGGGFGWVQREVPGADFSLDAEVKHSGSRSARLTFDGSQNLSYDSLYQQVLVSPKTRYRFRGYMRTDQISTDSGLRFEILDPKDSMHLDVLTANETGSQAWTLEETDFTTGPRTHLALVRLVRKASQRFDNKISGSVWIDDLSIILVPNRQ